jgi:ABC-type lipoprotein export system ATPase subunit
VRELDSVAKRLARVGSLVAAAELRLRRDHVGFVFQSFNLLPMLTAEENVGLRSRSPGEGPNVNGSTSCFSW